MKFKLVENIEHDVQETVLAEGITLNENINDGTVRLDSKIESGIDGSHIEAVILNPIEGTTSFVGHYIDGESVGNKFTFIYANEEGKEFVNRNGFDELGPTEILTVDGEDKGAYYIFDENELKNIKTDSTPITEDIEAGPSIRPSTRKLMAMVDEDIINVKTLAFNLLHYLSEDEVTDFANQYGYFEGEEEIEESFTESLKKSYKPHTMRLLKLIGSDLINECAEQPLNEGNPITDTLPPSIDQFLMDIAQVQGGIDYTDVSNFGKRATKEQIAKLRSLRRKYNNEMQYDEESEVVKNIVAQVVAVVKSEPITEAVTEVDLVLNDDEVMDLDERTGDITVYDDVIDYVPELPVTFKFAEDEDNLVHKYIMKDHDEEAGTIRLAYNGPDELTEELLMEGPFKAIKNAVTNHKADKATKKALEMDKNPEAKNWTYIVDGKSMSFSEYKELDDTKRANAIVLDKGFYIRRGTEDLSDRLIRYTKDNADTSGHEYSSKADRKAAAQKIKDDEKGSGINLRNYQYAELNSDGSVKENGKILSYADFIELDDAEKSKYQGVNKKGEVLTYDELAPAINEYNQKAAKKAEADAQTMIQDAEDEKAKNAAETGKNTYSKIQNTTTRKNAQGKTIKPKGKLTFISIEKDKDGKPVSTIDAAKYARLDKKTKQEYIARDSKGQEFDYKALLNLSRQAKKLKMESLDEEYGDILDDTILLEELFLDDELTCGDNCVNEDLNLIPGDEAMAGWIDNMSDDQIDAEVTNIQTITRKLKLERPEDLVILVDTEMYYDPASYHFVPVETTRYGSKRYEVEGIDMFVDQRNGNYYLYFSSEEAAKRYAKIIEDENDNLY